MDHTMDNSIQNETTQNQTDNIEIDRSQQQLLNKINNHKFVSTNQSKIISKSSIKHIAGGVRPHKKLTPLN